MEADPRNLRAAGEALYGTRWQSDLARDLEVAIRTVQRWDAGTHPVPETIWPELRELLGKRAATMLQLRRSLPKSK
jgi:hypothetical protein